ncbi:MAG: hypothetical protein U5K00_21365 [Melioribacteraceae bacterium]|nr:hypothetical protein [Melioribacteraceae bacterium]
MIDPEKTKSMQTNWIGKSTGTEVDFKVEGIEEKVSVFTTRTDTLFGVTYMVLAPEHELVNKITSLMNAKKKLKIYKSIQSLSDIERTSTVKEKTGVPTGAYGCNALLMVNDITNLGCGLCACKLRHRLCNGSSGT